MEQVHAIARGAAGLVETTIIPGIGHSPYREAPDATLAAMTTFLRSRGIVKNSAN